MDYIWTYWTKPHKGEISHFDIACLGLSTSLVKTHGKAKCIYTDTNGKKQIEKYAIGVECTDSLSDIQDEDNKKWAISKINTLSKIDYPCIHIDYDVFLWKEQIKSKSDFCCQSMEKGQNFTELYKKTTNDYILDCGIIPKEIKNYSENQIYAGYNMGYIQINNLNFLNIYVKESFSIFSKMKTFHNHNNIFPEQYLFYCMTSTYKKNVDVLFNNDSDWNDQCTKSGYTHLMEEKIYNRQSIFKKIMLRLKEYNPDCYSAIINDK